MNKKYNEKFIEDVKNLSYIVPLSFGTGIQIIFDRSFIHISGFQMIGVQAILFGSIIVLLSLYILYFILYKIPKYNYDKNIAIKNVKKFFTSKFMLMLIVTILYSIIFRYYLEKEYYISIYFLLIIINWIEQKDFYNDLNLSN